MILLKSASIFLIRDSLSYSSSSLSESVKSKFGGNSLLTWEVLDDGPGLGSSSTLQELFTCFDFLL